MTVITEIAKTMRKVFVRSFIVA